MLGLSKEAGKTSCEDRKKHSAILCNLNAERTGLQKNGIQCVNCVILRDLIAQIGAIWRCFGPTLRQTKFRFANRCDGAGIVETADSLNGRLRNVKDLLALQRLDQLPSTASCQESSWQAW